MKILYPTSIAYPSKLANPEQIVATVAALNAQGAVCELGLSQAAVRLPFPYTTFSGSKRSIILGLRYAWYAKRHGFTDIFCREDYLLFFIMLWSKLLWFRPRFFFEAHKMHDGAFFPMIITQVDGIVSITEGLRQDLIAAGAAPERIVVAPDGVDVRAFAHPESKERARARLRLPQDKTVALYIGQLSEWKGVETFFEVSALMPDITIAVIGGEEKDIAPLRERYPSIHFLGRRPYSELPHNQAAADILVLPNTGKEAISARHTSPLKLFSYMASGVPIVASDLPSLREVVGEEEVFFFEADNSESLANAIRGALANPEDAQQKAKRAAQKVKDYTWEARAETILAFLSFRG